MGRIAGGREGRYVAELEIWEIYAAADIAVSHGSGENGVNTALRKSGEQSILLQRLQRGIDLKCHQQHAILTEVQRRLRRRPGEQQQQQQRPRLQRRQSHFGSRCGQLHFT